MTILFVDECKTRGYTMVAASIDATRLQATRRELSRLRKPGQARVHFVRESDSRRRAILSSLCSFGLSARIYHVKGLHEAESRALCLAAIVDDAVAGDVSRVIIERDSSVEKRDREHVSTRLHAQRKYGEIRFEHAEASSDPGLWIPDALAWSHVRGGDWRRRISPMIEAVIALDPLSAKLGAPTVRKATEFTSHR